MAQEFDALLARIDDPALRDDLRRSFDKVRAKRTFGLVFESHLPERVTLPSHPIRRGVRAARKDDQHQVFIVGSVTRGIARLTPIGADDDPSAGQPTELPVGDLVVVAEFDEPIYPGLKHLESVHRGGDKPAHTVINAENHHALELLHFTHASKIDCIYIDPPYNTGARDWKYDNNYVDGDDSYRHSKWLAFMERRLLLARELLNPDNSVLIVTIDEHEVHRLAMLLEQTFPAAKVQMVTIVVNPKGVAQGGFARVEEHAIFCFFGSAGVSPTTDDLLSDSSTQRNTRFWKGLLRAGTNAAPSDGLGMVYPVHIDVESARVVGTGRTLRERISAGEISGDPNAWLPDSLRHEGPPGTHDVWPLRNDGSLGVWQAVPETLMTLTEAGQTKAVLRTEGWAVSYVPSGVRSKIDAGEIAVVGYAPSGSMLLEMQRDLTRAKTVWKRARHDAGWHGSVVLRHLLGDRRFDFPKSLYAVRDALDAVIGNKKDAVVLDFFAGSGTTCHALALLNASDGGSRVSISVTNNEVGAKEATALRASGVRPGDAGWETRGIFQNVTQPRIKAAVTGSRADGAAVDYYYENEIPAADGFDENVEFFELTYEDAQRVDADRSFDAIAPLLWLRSGSVGPILTEQCDPAGERRPYVIGDHYAILFDTDQWRSFVDHAPEGLGAAFIVTDSQSTFSTIVRELPGGIDTVRLYRNYLSTFEIGRPQSRGGSR